MGGGNIMHTNFSSSSSSSTVLSNFKPSVSTINTLSCTLCHCHNQLCSKQQVPSQGEVEDAVSALQEVIQAFQQISGSYDSRKVISGGYKRLSDAFRLLQSDPAVKRLVVSLSSDKALWDAFMSNVLHQKLVELPDSDTELDIGCDKEKDIGTD
ncbi:uncharacterized protein LOC114193621 isoform X2 [Vigna unguiculata]|uniref:uncharacterized protein LOC114193621 isoform X2 n=1 Tax=Vigna unguiculata TaxID=3917 RepID=UPI0010170E6A|nr:uncharacterized protein LOC114193621 isoform X2 [Vigna unguiculata]